MGGKFQYSVVGPLLGILIPFSAYLFLRLQPALDPLIVGPVHHFSIVTVVAIAAAGAAITIGIIGSRLRNIQVIFLAMAFISLSLVFALHGLSTPGFIHDNLVVPSISAELSVVLTTAWLWMSSVRSDHPVVAALSRRQQWLVPVWTALLTGFVIVMMWAPDLVEFIPLNRPPFQGAVSGFTIALAAVVGYQYWRSYRYSQFPLQLAIVFSCGWLALAQLIMTTAKLWRLSWWIYHFLLLGGIILFIAGLLAQYGKEGSLVHTIQSLFTSDLRERVESAISPSVRALVVATEARDRYTAGHTLRVTLMAVRIGEAMQLPPEKLRALSQGGIVHDVGKIEVPDGILNKPGPLTPEERAVIERHPATGFEMCKRLGFMKDELDVIRSHHEWWDGTGYPDGLKGTEIPLLARILAVADVYDALTSERSYRAPWSHEEARLYIVSRAGHQFDPECVAVWLQLIETDPEFYRSITRPRGSEAGGSFEAGAPIHV